jgi:hypothetical protein
VDFVNLLLSLWGNGVTVARLLHKWEQKNDVIDVIRIESYVEMMNSRKCE